MNENPATEDKIVHSFSKNSQERVCCSIRAYRGEMYIDLRVQFRKNQSDEWLPTKKGLSLRPELLGELEAGVARLKKAISEGV